VDPSAREELVDPAMVPALRFLTTNDFPPFNYTDELALFVRAHRGIERAFEFVPGDKHIEAAARDIELNHIARLEERQRSADMRFGGDMEHARAKGRGDDATI